MTEAQWRRVFEVYDSVWTLQPNSARDFLAGLNSEDPAVVREVEMMLDALRQQESSPPKTTEAPGQFAGIGIGRYDVIALIGTGSTGDVYGGRDRELGRPVALKFMSAEYAGTGSAAERFIREARAGSGLNHPNIITVLEVITWNSSPVIVMELVEGAALRALCGKPLPMPQAIAIGRQMLDALAFAHGRGIVHRDIKPENVMVRPDGYVKLLDFGLARPSFLEASAGAGGQNVSSTAGLPVGTLRYMSPEQCRGERATPASDVFAAGIVLYEMIAGKHPFQADSPIDTAHRILEAQPEPPPTLRALLLQMLAKRAEERPSASEAAKALTNLQGKAKARKAFGVQVTLATIAIGALAGGVAVEVVRHRPSESLLVARQVTFQDSTNRVTAATISPDGQSFAFATLNGQVCLRNVEGTVDKVVARFDHDRVDTMFWVRERRRLLLSTRDLTSASNSYHVWWLDLDHGELRQLPISGKHAAPSYDGHKIAYLSPNSAEILIADAEGGQARRLVVTSGNLKSFA